MQAGTSNITKEDFFPAFLAAFRGSIQVTGNNSPGGFRGAGHSESVIFRLDVKLRTLTPVEGDQGVDGLPAPWVPQKPHNPTEASSQSDFIKYRIPRHQESSPTYIMYAVDQFGICVARNHASGVFAKVEGLDPSTRE